MVSFTATLLKFEKKGEKTGWTYIDIPNSIASQIKPNTKVSYRVKGKIDEFLIKQVALAPMGDGNFILPINQSIRKGIGKKQGAKVIVQLIYDPSELTINIDFIDCLKDEPKALSFFDSLSKSHQNYFSKWIDSAKTEATKEKRILMAINALSKSLGYPEMIRANKEIK
jgi:hypothetical protein